MHISTLYIMILLALFSCSNTANKEDKIHAEWQPGINAPRPYPITFMRNK